MRTLAIGDIHGCLTSLRTLAAFVPFRAVDTLVGIGDYVDRGPDSKEVVDWLMEWGRSRRMHLLKGNHELMMLHALESPTQLRSWLEVGGLQTMESYQQPGTKPSLSAVPENHREFLAKTLPYLESDTHIFVHASLGPDKELEDQSDTQIYWERVTFEEEPHLSGKHVICGHTPQKRGVPKSNGHITCIDTFAYGGGWLTALDVETGRYWQANQSGDTREGVVENYPVGTAAGDA